MTDRRLGIFLLFVAGIALALLWHVLPPILPPLYDSVVGPIPPYRYVTPPVGLGPQHHNPTSASDTVPVTGKTSPEEYLTTKERMPQAVLALADGALRIPSGVTHITFAVQPVPPPAPITNGTLDGNVYRFSATGNNGAPLAIIPNVGARVEMRKTGSEVTAVVEQYAGGQWQKRHTLSFVNVDYLATDATSLGYYALVFPGGASTSSSTSRLPFIIAGVVILALVVAGLVALRILRRAPSTA